MDDVFANILFVLFLCGIAVLAVSLFFYYQLLKRHAFLDMARALHFRYYYRSYAIPMRFAFLRQQRRGRGRHASNILVGRYTNQDVVIFDYMFSVGLGADKRRHCGSFAVMHHGRDCPSLRIYPKSMLSTLGQIVGFDEVFLDGHELADRFAVYTTNEQFAKGVLDTPVVDYLARHPEISLEIDPMWIAVGREETLIPEDIPYRLKQISKIRTAVAL